MIGSLDAVVRSIDPTLPQTAGLVLARLLPIVTVTPVFGGRSTPTRFRVGLAIALSCAFTVMLWPHATDVLSVGVWLGLALKEVLVGLTLALAVLVVFEGLAAAGELVDLTRDATVATLFDPMVAGHASVTAALVRRLSLVVFFGMGGAAVFCYALAQSFIAVPVHQALPADVVGPSVGAGYAVLLGKLLLIAVGLASPVMLVMLSLEVALALTARAAEGVDVFFLARGLKAPLGLLAFMVVLGYAFESTLALAADSVLMWMTRGDLLVNLAGIGR